MIFNIKHTANWEYIRQRKHQDLISKNNKRENPGRVIHDYKVGEKVLLKRGNENKYESPYQGPFEILKVLNDNGTVRLTVNSVTDTYNIRRLVPYTSENDTNGGECNMRISKKRRKN